MMYLFRKIPTTNICYLAIEYRLITIKMEKEGLVSFLKYLLTYMKFVIKNFWNTRFQILIAVLLENRVF